MIKDIIDKENYFDDEKKLIEWLDVDTEIEKEMNISLSECKTVQDFVDFANEYTLIIDGGIQTHRFEIF